MKVYKYTDATEQIAHVIDGDGVSRMSMLASAVPDGAEILPADPEPPAAPHLVTRRQARRALALAGVLELVQSALDAIPDPTQRTLAKIDWDDALEFRRDDPTLLMIAAGLGLTEEQLDDLFILAGGQP